MFILYVLCDTADNVKNCFEEINVYEQCDWYTLSIDVQQKICMIMTNTQQPAAIKAFGNFECTRETFKRVG